MSSPSASTSPSSSSDLSASAHEASPTPPPTPPPPPPSFPGETFLSTWPNLKFFLGAPDPSASTWATLAAFYGTGTAHLSTCRLVFVLQPPPPRGSDVPSSLSIPLVWLQADRLRLCRPFFDADHLAGVLVPADLSASLPASHVFAPPGKPMRFRIEALDPDRNHALCAELKSLLSDPDRVARNTRALRHAADTQLIPTDSHYAFVDPRNPGVLHLATLMAQPDDADLVPHHAG